MSNREIKFRAWSNELKRYFYAPSDSWSLVFHDTGNLIQMWCSDGLVDEIPVDFIEQFTGLTDKNGNEIYEGDIVCEKGLDFDSKEYQEWMDNDDFDGDKDSILESLVPVIRKNIDVVTMTRFPCYWLEKESFGWEGEDLAQSYDYEIVGNIHQNPELLEASK